MARRTSGSGSIYQRKDGRWVGELTLGWERTPEGRKRRRSRAFYGKTAKEVEAQLHKARRERDAGARNMAPDRLTLGRYLNDWLATVRPEIRPNSYGAYSYACGLVTAELGDIPLQKLESAQVQAFITALSARYGHATVRDARAILSRALRRAVVLGLLSRDVASAAIVRVPTAPMQTIQPYTESQVQAFLRAAQGTPLYALWAIGFTLGLRKGEMLALRWEHIDLERGTLAVRGTLGRQSGVKKLEVADPKTRSSRRTIKLPPTLIGILQQHARDRKAAQLRARTWHDTGYVFTTRTGTPMDPKNLMLAFRRVISETGLPLIRLHDMRHTAATIMLSKGVDIVTVAHILGHSSPTITLRVYGHVLDTMRDSAASVIEELLQDVI